VAAPAKINLGLEIVGRRDDGYHEIATILQAIRLHDQLTLEPADGIRSTGPLPDIPDGENLALRALHLLSERTGGDRGHGWTSGSPSPPPPASAAPAPTPPPRCSPPATSGA
jgi:4-diphosphocytidyl-2C-methyl-D-erythritol kinase